MEGWQRLSLNKFVTFQRGYDLPKSEFVEGKIPVYGSTSILGHHNQSKVKAPGVITGRSGTLGRFQYANEDYWPHNTTLWVKDFKGNNPRFAYYLMQCLDFEIFNGGGAVPTLNRNVLKSFKVDVPPLPIQKKIADILSAYDDLIENNLKRIKLLEELAQITYEEWFVRLRFPGHESTPINPETNLPEGWAKTKLGEMCTLTMGQSPKSEFYNFEGKGLPFHQGVKDYGERFPTNACWCTSGSRYAERGDILFSVRAPVGRLNIALEKMILGRGLAAIRHKDNAQGFLYYLLKKQFFEEDMMGGGAIFNSVTKNDMHRIEVVAPSPSILNDFNQIVEATDRQIEILHCQNVRLREARDILLPRLMTGMIDVEQYNPAVMPLKNGIQNNEGLDPDFRQSNEEVSA